MADGDKEEGPTLLEQMLRDSGASVSGAAAGPGHPKQQEQQGQRPADAAKGFGSGLRRGFLSQGPIQPTKPKMPTIKPGASPFMLPEVQAALAQGEAQAPDSSDVIKRIWASPELREAMLDPRSMGYIAALAEDPGKAIAQHKDDPGFVAFLSSFSHVLGEHFETLGKQQQQHQQQPQPSSWTMQGPLVEEALRKRAEQAKITEVTAADREALARERAEQAAADEILRDPEVRALLLEPEVQAVLQACRDVGRSDDESSTAREREALARRLLRDPEMAGKLRRLAAAGVVRFE